MPGLLDPDVDRYILDSAGEYKVLEVRKHWVASAWPAFRVLVAVLVAVSGMFAPEPVDYVILTVALIFGGQALWRLVEEQRDRFVITNQRVFRVHGNLSTARASVPLSRILDITVNKPLVGQLLDYGHFVFESAAQVQGLNEIRYVGRIDATEDTLRLAMQGDVPQVVIAEEDDGT